MFILFALWFAFSSHAFGTHASDLPQVMECASTSSIEASEIEAEFDDDFTFTFANQFIFVKLKRTTYALQVLAPNEVLCAFSFIRAPPVN